MRGDDGIGIIMHLQDHDREINLVTSIDLVNEMKKNVEKMEKILAYFTNIKQKYNGIIDYERCTGKELNVLIHFVFPKSGLLSKAVPLKKKEFCEKGITQENINYLAVEEGKKLTTLKLEPTKVEIERSEFDAGKNYNDDNGEEHMCDEI